MSNYTEYQLLLEDLKKHSFKTRRKEANIFDVAGYPHYENVASNILKFLFDSSEEHGFGDLWIKSLLEVYNSKAIKRIDINYLETKNIRREYYNGDDKRIDLLIDCNPLIVVIENKIYASVNNPFDIYTDMALNYVKDNKIKDYKLIKIVLSVSKEKLNKEYGFINITYDELFDRVECNLPNYKPVLKWKLFAEDFILNLQRKKEETVMSFDKEWIDFVNKNGKSMNLLLKQYELDLNERLLILKSINTNLTDIKYGHGVYNYGSERYFSQYINIKMKDGNTICLETYLMKMATHQEYEDYDKLYISLWCRTHRRNYDFDYILKVLPVDNPKERITNGPSSWGKHYILDEITITDVFNVDDISSKIKDYIVEIETLL